MSEFVATDSPSEEEFVYPVMNYRLKQEPVVVRAIQYHGFQSNSKEVELFLGDCFVEHLEEGNKIVANLDGEAFEVDPGWWFFERQPQPGDEHAQALYLADAESFANTYTQVSEDFPYIGPECFSDKDEKVISLKGENFYRACGAPVTKLTSCTKRVDHPGIMHEDWEGEQVLREEYQNGTAPRDSFKVIWPRNVFGIPITKADMKNLWNEQVMPLAAKPREELTPTEHTLMAVLRHVYGAMPEDEA